MLLIHFSSFDINDYLAEFGVKAISKEALKKMKKIAKANNDELKKLKMDNRGWNKDKLANIEALVEDQFVLAGTGGKQAASDLAEEYTKKGLGRFVPKRSNQAITGSSKRLQQSPQTLNKDNLKYNPKLKGSKLNLDSDGYYYGLPENRTTTYTKGTTDINDYINFPYSDKNAMKLSQNLLDTDDTRKRYIDALNKIDDQNLDRTNYLVGWGDKVDDFGQNRQYKITEQRPKKWKPLQEKRSITEQIERNNKVGTDKVGTDKVGTDKVGTDKVGTDKVGTDKIGTDKVGTDKVGTDKVGTDKIGTDKVGTDKSLAKMEAEEKQRLKRKITPGDVIGSPVGILVGGTAAIGAAGVAGSAGIKGYLDRKKQRRLQRINKQYG
jgi:hypothetical protein